MPQTSAHILEPLGPLDECEDAAEQAVRDRFIGECVKPSAKLQHISGAIEAVQRSTEAEYMYVATHVCLTGPSTHPDIDDARVELWASRPQPDNPDPLGGDYLEWFFTDPYAMDDGHKWRVYFCPHCGINLDDLILFR